MLAGLLRVGDSDRVLEPAAGDGALIEALLGRGVRPEQITAWELDPDTCAELGRRYPGITVEQRDALLSVDPARWPRFDRIIANPPYLSKQSHYVRANRDALRRRFSAIGSSETYAMFLDLCLSLLAPKGCLAFLVSDTIRTLRSHERLRARILADYRLEAVVAMPERLFTGASVRTCMLSVSRGSSGTVRVLPHARTETDYSDPASWGELTQASLRDLPGRPLATVLPTGVEALLREGQPLGELARSHIGMHTTDNAVSLAALAGSSMARTYERRRESEGGDPARWRVIEAGVAAGAGWRPYLRQGGVRDFAAPIEEFVDWSPAARANYKGAGGALFGEPGVAVSGVASRLSARLMDAGSLWDSNKALGVVAHRAEDRLLILGLLCSDLYAFIAKALLNDSPSIQLSDLLSLRIPIHGREEIRRACAGCVAAVSDPPALGRARAELDEAVYAAARITPADRAVINGWLGARGIGR